MNQIKEIVYRLKDSGPLVLSLTNFVTMEFVANCLLAVGAAPIMWLSEDGLEELVALSSVIYINTGTLSASSKGLMRKAVELSLRYEKQIVLDPVGAGATSIITELARDVARAAKIIRGNASEILALGNESFLSRGVEAVHTTEQAVGTADAIASELGATIVVSGAVDYVTDGDRSEKSAFGSPIMKNITGMGCAMTSVIAAMLAVEDDPFIAAKVGAQYFSICGELASSVSKSPGSFRTAFIDSLYEANFELIRGLYDRRE